MYAYEYEYIYNHSDPGFVLTSVDAFSFWTFSVDHKKRRRNAGVSFLSMAGCSFGSNTVPSSGIIFHLVSQSVPDPFLSVGILSLQEMLLPEIL